MHSLNWTNHSVSIIAPAVTTILIRGGRALLPNGDWDQPEQVDMAGDRIAGRAAAYDRRATTLSRCSMAATV
jgi:hypothetical protein